MDRTTIAAACAVALVVYMLVEQDGNEEDDPGYQEPDLIDQANALFQDLTDMGINDPQEQKNLSAFLWTIRVSEGTAGSDGYQTLVGGSLFSGFGDHPRTLVYLPNLGIKSSAAGAYQILRRTWDGVAARLGLPDFSPQSQDRAAVELVRQRGALADVRAGRFASAIERCKKEWASLPGAGYGQHENSLARLQTAYTQAGGMTA